VRDHDQLAAVLAAAGVAFSHVMDSIVVAPQTAMGATLAFD
jgi:hypothetical protein